MGLFSKINFGLAKTRNKMAGAIDDMLDAFDSFEEDLYTELEEILVMSDVSVNTAVQVVEELKQRVKSERIKSTKEVKKELCNIIAELLYGGEDMGLITVPSLILVIGVNGAGKTTTIGKMAAMYKAKGKKVLLGAADTFRAAAIDQLDVWAKRAGVDIIKHKEGADPAAVVYDTIQAGTARDCDIIICDTAGRLHNKKNLMEELAKIYRVCDKELPYADREILLVLDATTGQNAVNQAKEFMGVAELTGIVLTKLDGTARGGVVLSIKNDLKLPVKFIGVGEGIDDLQPFSPEAFAKSLFEAADEKEINKGTEGDSLSELVKGDDYVNYIPRDAGDGSAEDVKGILADILMQAGSPEEEAEAAAPEGSQDTASHEKREEKREKGSEASRQADSQDIEAVRDSGVRPTGGGSAAEEPSADKTVSTYESAPAAARVNSEDGQRQTAGSKADSESDDTTEGSAKPAKKERRGFFGLFSRHS